MYINRSGGACLRPVAGAFIRPVADAFSDPYTEGRRQAPSLRWVGQLNFIQERIIMKTLKFIVLFTIVISLLSSCKITAPDENEVRTIRIINHTEITFERLRIRLAGETNWGQTFNREFGHGQHEIFLTRFLDSEQRYDIQLYRRFWDSGSYKEQTATLYAEPVSENILLPFDYENFDDQTALEITALYINNRTGTDFSAVYIGVVGSSGWVFDKIDSIINDDFYYITNIYPPLKATTQYRIQLRAGNITATKTNLSVTQNRTINFTENDFDLTAIYSAGIVQIY